MIRQCLILCHITVPLFLFSDEYCFQLKQEYEGAGSDSSLVRKVGRILLFVLTVVIVL